MTPPGKVTASSGAEWLLGGFGLMKKEPLALGLVGLVFAIVSVLPLLFAGAGPLVSMLAQLVLVLLTPILLGGLVYAVREVDQGRSARPGQLLQGFREGKSLALMAQLIPQFAGLILAIVLLLLFVGPTALQGLMSAMEQAQAQANPDPALFEGFPFFALMLWLVVAMVLGLFIYTFTFLFPAQVMLEGTGAFEAMKRSFRACMQNIGAFLVFIVMLFIVMFAMFIGAQILALVLRIFAGEMAAAIASQLLLMAVLMPVLMGATYLAWRQLLGGGPAADGRSVQPVSGIEV